MSEPQVDGSTALEVYKNLAIERATVLAAIRASEASPDSPATELLELNALLRRVNNQIAVLGVTKGDYYIDGKVTRPGVYSIGQNDVSLKQAIIAAGLTQIDDLPIHIIRLDPRSLKETVIQRNLKDIFDALKSQIGEEGGDLMLKADDTVLVGITPPIKQPTTAPTK